MDIIISANHNILAMVKNSELNISEDMGEEEYWKWMQGDTGNLGSETEYRKSRFNFVAHNDKGHLVYNTLYSSLSRLNDEEYRQYLMHESAQGKLQAEFEEQGILVGKRIDELKLYNIYTFLSSKYMRLKPNITVTPTMECNARCFYCYEKGVRGGAMESGSAEKIINFLKKMDLSRGINLTWFGGEPLMNQEWMDYFSECLREEHIDFSAYMISNGSMVDDGVIFKMINNWKVTSMQITFDGSCDEYVKRKNYINQDENIYYQMLRKVKKIANAGISVQIRLNIDKSNIDSILELVDDLQQVFSEDVNVTYYPAFLTGGKDVFTEREKIDIVKWIMEADRNKLPVNKYLYKLPKVSACYYNQKMAYSIDVSGDVFICERMLGYHDKALGNVKDKLEYEERELSGRRKECQMCVFLPKCQGGCQDALVHGEMPCFIDKYVIMAYMELI